MHVCALSQKIRKLQLRQETRKETLVHLTRGRKGTEPCAMLEQNTEIHHVQGNETTKPHTPFRQAHYNVARPGITTSIPPRQTLCPIHPKHPTRHSVISEHQGGAIVLSGMSGSTSTSYSHPTNTNVHTTGHTTHMLVHAAMKQKIIKLQLRQETRLNPVHLHKGRA